LQYFAVLFVAVTVVAGLLAYRVVKDRDGAPPPADALVRAEK
jgi:cytochrome bd-type quinol oxidase subunit 1